METVPLKIILYDKGYIEKSKLPPKQLLWLQKNFTHNNPLYDFYVKNKFSTRGINKYIESYLENEEWFIFPVGAINSILKFFNFYQFPYEVIDKRQEGKDIDISFNSINPDTNQEIIWEDYQEEAFQAMLQTKWSNGLLQLPPGAGKTLLAIRYICEIKKNSLIIVHENRLVNQWKSEIETRVRGNYTVEIFSGSEGHKFGDITIVLIQSGHKYVQFYEEYTQFGCVIVDECHHSNSMMFDKLLNNLPAKRKFGLSGTLKRKDKMDFLIPLYLGEKVVDIPDSKTKSRIMDFSVEFINTNCSFELPIRETNKRYKVIEEFYDEDNEENPINFTALYELITGFKGFEFYSGIRKEELLEIGNQGIAGKRNRLILQKVKQDIDAGYKVLILTNRKAHSLWLLYSLQDLGYNGVSFTNDSKTKETVDFNSLREGLDERDGFEKIDFIVSTEKIASEGLDITDLSSIHILIPTTNQYKLKQCLGRVRRYKKNKMVPVVRDYVDTQAFTINTDNSSFANLFNNNSQKDYFYIASKMRLNFYKKWRNDYYN
ncbi:MAG: DEAD/DEAH box helicase family protein [candidate division WOR-3 bacterium]